MGFIFGPLFGIAFANLEPPPPGEPALTFDRNTAPAFLAFAGCIVNIWVLWKYFREVQVNVNQGGDDKGGATTLADAVTKDNDEDESSTDPAPVAGSSGSRKGNAKYGGRDDVAVYTLLLCFFANYFVLSVFETIQVPITIDEFGWTEKAADVKNGIVNGAFGFQAVVFFIASKPISAKFGERPVLITGLLIVAFAMFMTIPVAGTDPFYQSPWKNPQQYCTALYNAQDTTTPQYNATFYNGTDTTDRCTRTDGWCTTAEIRDWYRGANGCPLGGKTACTPSAWQQQVCSGVPASNNGSFDYGLWRARNNCTGVVNRQSLAPNSEAMRRSYQCYECVELPKPYPSWCDSAPAVTMAQFFIGGIFVNVGFPMVSVMIFTLYSKVLGPFKQGLWMGYLNGCGSLARLLGPVIIMGLYQGQGPTDVYISVGCVVLVVTGVAWLMYSRLIIHPLQRAL